MLIKLITMKKLLYIFLGLSLIFACSDDSPSDDSTSIEGRWNLISITDCGNVQELNSCALQSYITFNNELGESFFYFDDGSNTPCEIETEVFSYYAATDSPNTYAISFEGDTLTATVTDNTLTVIEEFNASDTGCPQQEGTIIEVTTFTRN